jgi:HSP20 family protein
VTQRSRAIRIRRRGERVEVSGSARTEGDNLSGKHKDIEKENTMNTLLRWSPTRQFHFHYDVDDLSERFFGGAPDEEAQPAASWLPTAEGRFEDGTYVIQLALPGVDPKDVAVSLMDSVLTVKGEHTPDDDTAGKEYFVREVAYGTFQRSFRLPEGVDAAQVEAKSVNGMLEVRVAMPRAATLRTIEVKAA